jgi:uncharacterized protein YciI
MNGLAEEGLLLCAGPLAGTETRRLRALLIINADNEDEIRHRLDHDPWVRTDRLVITRVEPWNVIVGAERLATSGTATHPGWSRPSARSKNAASGASSGSARGRDLRRPLPSSGERVRRGYAGCRSPNQE